MPIYLNLPGVMGNVDDDGDFRHKGWIELETCLLDTPEAQVKSLGGYRSTDPKGVPYEAACTRQLDSTSTMLRRLSDAETVAKWVTVHFINRKGVIFLSVQLVDVTVAFHSYSGADNAPHLESFSLLSQEMKTEFRIVN